MNEVDEIVDEIKFFIKEREWDRYHTPKNIAISISIEANELLEKFQWNDLSFQDVIINEKIKEEISDELADIFIYSLIFLNKAKLDFGEIIKKKIGKNREKYPISQ
ncbi:MAG: nucleotide pyrophosphohydrolase [Thermoplasmatales archaeon]|nr:nucleotide pyrophosphohydrolase [Thermoplasmatales archaeon]